jgi:hypothetical protein
MSHLRNALLAGAAVVTLAGAASLAQAQTTDTPAGVHVMNVRLPDGAVQQIAYTGDVAPRIVFVPVAQQVASPFALLERVSEQMDRQMAMMMQAFSPMMTQTFAGAPIQAGFGVMPAGAGVCMRSISVTYTGNGQPHVVSKTAGNCGATAPAANAPVALPETVAPAPSLRTIQVKDEHPVGQPAYRGLVIPAADLRG